MYLYTVAVSGQECTGTVGSLSHDSNIVTVSQTFILAGYTIPCSGTVVAWECCYRISYNKSVTFYPGIWRITRTMGINTDYELIQSNSVIYDSTIQTSGNDGCQRVNISTTDQFTAPSGSVVGLYSNVETQLLHTNTNNSITTYRFSGNQSSVTAGNDDDVNYNIAIRVHLGKYISMILKWMVCICIYPWCAVSTVSILCLISVCVHTFQTHCTHSRYSNLWVMNKCSHHPLIPL